MGRSTEILDPFTHGTQLRELAGLARHDRLFALKHLGTRRLSQRRRKRHLDGPVPNADGAALTQCVNERQELVVGRKVWQLA